MVSFSGMWSSVSRCRRAAAVQLLFQNLGGLGVGDALLPCCDQGCDAPFQPCILMDGQTGLTDEGAALIDFLCDAQQRFAAGGARQIGYTVTGSGVDGLKLAHGCGLAAGASGDRQILFSVPAIQPAAHSGAGPGGIADLVGNEPGLFPFPAVDAVQHGEQECTPGGLSCFVGGFYNIESVLQLQRLPLKAPKDG